MVTPHVEGWTLVWSDEFDYEGLPDKTKWDYEEGFIRNEELQYYTRGRLENARVEQGMLVIEGRKELFANAHFNAASEDWRKNREFAEYTAACLVTKQSAAWTYGRIEVRAKFPYGEGVWPAIWMLGTNIDKVSWPFCGEIDIMEFVGKDPNHIHATLHFAKNGEHASTNTALEVEAPFADFHTYVVEWFPDHIDFFFDETKYHCMDLDEAGQGADNPYRKPHFLLINLALGGAWGGPVMDDTVLPQAFLIDYVRVYKRHES